MAFTEAQKVSIRRYLGYPSVFKYQNPRLEGVLTGALSVDEETVAISIIAQIAAFDTALNSAGSVIQTAGIKAVDDIEFFAQSDGNKASETRVLARRQVANLSQLLGVPVLADFFGSGGYPGDDFSPFGGAGGGGGGGVIPLG